jgi:hypothetical protein
MPLSANAGVRGTPIARSLMAVVSGANKKALAPVHLDRVGL